MSVTRSKLWLALPGLTLVTLWLCVTAPTLAQAPAISQTQQQLRALYRAQQYDQVIAIMASSPQLTDEASLSLLAASHSRLNQEAGYVQTLELLLAHHPKPKYWADRLARLQQQPDFAPSLGLELYRLQFAVDAMSSKAEFLEMAQLTQQAGFPGEALTVLDSAIARGLLDPKEVQVSAQRDRLSAMAREDKASLARTAARASGAQALSINGWAMATLGDYASALPVLQKAITSAGSATQISRATLRLAHTQALAGQTSSARATFSTVQGSDGSAELARLWTIHLLKATP